MCLGACRLICIREVVLDFLTYVFCNIFMMKELKDSLGLFHIDSEELPVLIDTLRVKGFVKGFLNFETVTCLYFASVLTFERDRNPCGVEFPHSFVDIFLSGHSNLNKAWHDWIR